MIPCQSPYVWEPFVIKKDATSVDIFEKEMVDKVKE